MPKALAISRRAAQKHGLVFLALALLGITGIMLTQQTNKTTQTIPTSTASVESASINKQTTNTDTSTATATSDETNSGASTASASSTSPKTSSGTSSSTQSHTTTSKGNRTNTESSQATTSNPCSAIRAGTEPANALRVTLRVNDCATHAVTLPSGATQCDVLTYAVAQGVLTSVDIHLDSGLNKPGVYRINSQGDTRSVWWVYYVNGKSPSKGCSEVAAENGDSIYWKYLK